MNGQPPKRMASLAIGISTAQPLPYMRGAIHGATEFHNWASSVGYESELLTDVDDLPVTIPRLRQRLEEVLTRAPDTTPSEPIYRLVLYFAGHGIIRDAGAALWLLSDWFTEGKAVDVEQLKRRIARYGVSQISVFADACKKFPENIDTGDLDEDSVLGMGPVRPVYPPYIDTFDAVQDGYPALMIPGQSEAEDRCLFSGVLMEGLWGSPSALSAQVTGKVTSHSLSDFLRAEVPKRAATYERKLFPNTQPMFPPDSAVYFCDLQPPPPPPSFRPWPDPSLVLGTAHPPSVQPDTAKPGLGNLVGGIIGALVGSVSGFQAVTEMPSSSVTDVIRGWNRARKDADPAAPSSTPPAPPRPDPGEILQQKISTQQVPTHFETGSGFAVEGALIRTVWTPPGNIAGTGGRPDWWHVGDANRGWLQKPAPVLIELSDGQFLALTALPAFIASLVCNERGAQALIYRAIYEDKDTSGIAANALAQMESGALRANAVLDLSVELRQLKHTDPTLGVISAYLYDSVGDLDNIRRMAYYYVQHGQAIPYDIALLAQIPSWRNPDGLLEVAIPQVEARDPRTDVERQNDWTWTMTPATNGIVGGFWPWMRQGWTFLEDPTDVEMGLVDPRIAALRPHLTSARFTTLTADGGQRLAAILGLIPQIP